MQIIVRRFVGEKTKLLINAWAHTQDIVYFSIKKTQNKARDTCLLENR